MNEHDELCRWCDYYAAHPWYQGFCTEDCLESSERHDERLAA